MGRTSAGGHPGAVLQERHLAAPIRSSVAAFVSKMPTRRPARAKTRLSGRPTWPPPPRTTTSRSLTTTPYLEAVRRFVHRVAHSACLRGGGKGSLTTSGSRVYHQNCRCRRIGMIGSGVSACRDARSAASRDGSGSDAASATRGGFPTAPAAISRCMRNSAPKYSMRNATVTTAWTGSRSPMSTKRTGYPIV